MFETAPFPIPQTGLVSRQKVMCEIKCVFVDLRVRQADLSNVSLILLILLGFFGRLTLLLGYALLLNGYPPLLVGLSLLLLRNSFLLNCGGSLLIGFDFLLFGDSFLFDGNFALLISLLFL